MRGEDGGVGLQRAEQLGDEVERPRVDDEGHARLPAELHELERVLAPILVEAGADEGGLDAPANGNDARLVGEHEVLDAPGRVEANHAHARGQRPTCGENTSTRVGVGSRDEADDAAGVLVV